MRRRIYPWEFWFAQGALLLRRGRDYACSTLSMAQMVRGEASERGYRCEIEEVNGGLRVRLTRREPETVDA